MLSKRPVSAQIVSLTLLGLAGCASDGGMDKTASSADSASKSADHAKFSGFLSDYSNLKLNPNFKNTLDWVSPDLAGSNYSAIIIEPVVTHLDPALMEAGAKPNAQVLNPITEYFHQALTGIQQILHRHRQGKAGNGVMRYRAAITGVDAERDMGDNPLDFLPVILVARTATGANSLKARIFMESIYTDSVTGQVQAKLVQSATGGDTAKEISIDSVRSALDARAKKAAEDTKAALDKRGTS